MDYIPPSITKPANERTWIVTENKTFYNVTPAVTKDTDYVMLTLQFLKATNNSMMTAIDETLSQADKPTLLTLQFIRLVLAQQNICINQCIEKAKLS